MQEATKTVINPFFVHAMQQMNEDCSLENQNKMVSAMMEAHLLTPVMRQEREKAEVGRPNLRMNFLSIKDKKGDPYILAFTDLVELKKWSKGKETDRMIMEFDDYARLLAPKGVPFKGFVINPFSENIVVSKAMAMKLMQRKEELENSQS